MTKSHFALRCTPPLACTLCRQELDIAARERSSSRRNARDSGKISREPAAPRSHGAPSVGLSTLFSSRGSRQRTRRRRGDTYGHTSRSRVRPARSVWREPRHIHNGRPQASSRSQRTRPISPRLERDWHRPGTPAAPSRPFREAETALAPISRTKCRSWDATPSRAIRYLVRTTLVKWPPHRSSLEGY